MSIPIFVCGFPKSGTTWLTRLLGDIIHAPTGGSIPKLDSTEIATEGQDRQSNFVVRKGHYVLNLSNELLFPERAHTLSLRDVSFYQVVHIVRDPRDIVVSASHHWNNFPEKTLLHMVKGDGPFRHTGSWNSFMKSWMALRKDVQFIRYEDLLFDGINVACSLVDRLGFKISPAIVKEAYDRQRFQVRKQHVTEHGAEYPLGAEFNQKFMRRGKSGDWLSVFTTDMAFTTEVNFGNVMRFFGYVDSTDWWKKWKHR